MQSALCKVGDDIEKTFRKFKFSRKNERSCIILKCNPNDLVVEVDDVIDEVDFDEISEDMPAASPRYYIFSYKISLKDDRVKIPICLVYYSPPAVSTRLNMIYSSTKSLLVQKLEIQILMEIRDPEEFTEEWLSEELLKRA